MYYYKFDNGICEFEFDHVIMGEYYGSYKLDPKEAEAAVWMEKTELLGGYAGKPTEIYTVVFDLCRGSFEENMIWRVLSPALSFF